MSVAREAFGSRGNAVTDVAAGDHVAPRFGVQRGEPFWFAMFRVLERHAFALAALVWFPANASLLALCAASYAIRMFGMEAIYHRYFSHRAFKASRPMQLALALAGTQCGLRGPLWWASKHRDHHRYVETKRDPHSPIAHSFWYAYLAWMRAPGNFDTDLDWIPDFARHAELRWLNRFYAIPLYAGAALLFLAGHYGWLGTGVTGVAALLWGFYVPTLLVLHGGGLVATVTHMPKIPGGYRRFETADCSVNRPLLGLLLLGAGWHNNHHRHSASARAGFAWYELDVSYWVLRGLAAMRLIRGLRSQIPADVLTEGGIGKARVASPAP